MKFIKLSTSLFLLFAILSCSKYEEGPSFTLIGKPQTLSKMETHTEIKFIMNIIILKIRIH